MSSLAGMETAWREIVSGRDRTARGALARLGLLPLAWLYGAVIAAYRALYRSGVLRTVRLPCATIGVGNLTVGGTGKSTTVRWLVRRLVADGYRVAVLSYGYHRKSAQGSGLRAQGSEPRALSSEPRAERAIVVSDGRDVLVPVAVSGDEPRMLAEALPGVPVLAGPRRVLSGARAVEEFGAEVLVLDDAFQYWRLRKDLEIVLIDAEAPFGYGHLLPRGLLRESPRVLDHADVVIVMNADRVAAGERRRLMNRLARLAPEALRVEGRHRPSGLRSPDRASAPIPLAWLAGKRVIAVSSLGNPDGFVRSLRDLGTADIMERRFPDHHLYTVDEAREALRLDPPWDAVVTTAKDAPKLLEAVGSCQLTVDGKDGNPSQLSTVNCQLSTALYVLEVDLDLGTDEASVIDRVRQRIGGSTNHSVAVE
jgi:tetraacyldisaccharide 4'-kinase